MFYPNTNTDKIHSKLIKIIYSCKSQEQFDSAMNWINFLSESNLIDIDYDLYYRHAEIHADTILIHGYNYFKRE